VPRAERARFLRPKLPLWLRISMLAAGWLLVLLGIVGIFLPILQGGLSLLLGLALLSIASQKVHLKLRSWMRRWPAGWRRMEKLRRRIHRWLAPKPGDGGD